MTRTFSWRVKLLAATISAFATVAAVSVAGEAAVRYREWHRSTVPGLMPFLYYRHGQLGHPLVRDYDYFGSVHIQDLIRLQTELHAYRPGSTSPLRKPSASEW